jgi:hypothetical protein
MMTRKLVPSLACLALLVAAVPGAHAARLAACRRACAPAVEQCVRERPGKAGKARRQCRKELLRSCKQGGTTACELAPPTTTSTTVTTTTTLPTTTTTVVVVHDFGGTWLFTGALSENSCPGVTDGLQDTFTVVQSGTSVTVTIGSIPDVVMRGTVDADGLQASGVVNDGTCTTEIALVASPDGNFTVTAATGFDVTCGGSSCRVIWAGSMSRE